MRHAFLVLGLTLDPREFVPWAKPFLTSDRDLPRRNESSGEKACDPPFFQNFFTRGARPRGSHHYRDPQEDVYGTSGLDYHGIGMRALTAPKRIIPVAESGRGWPTAMEAQPCVLENEAAKVPPTSIVIFGATGDLTHRKIIPAIYHLEKEGRLDAGCAIIGYARRPKTDDEFRAELRQALGEVSRSKPVDETIWRRLANRIYYQQVDLLDEQGYQQLAARLQALPESARFGQTHLFYLATAPEYFGPIAERLARAGLTPLPGSPAPRRLIVEKPFGRDLSSAQELNRILHTHFPEDSIFRIDHYLGKETVQNLLYFRFGNSIYEPLWNRRYIDHVQITVAEKLEVGRRGGYYDSAGALRDMLQNHIFQLLTLIAMEPPASLRAAAIHAEKLKVLQSIALPAEDELLARSVRAQYAAGAIDGRPIPAYCQEPGVAPHSKTETFVAWKLEVDNWRWSGVPFYVRTGKALARQFTEINIVFNRPPSVLFAAVCGQRLSRNVLRIRIQPNEGIQWIFNAKLPGRQAIHEVGMDFFYRKDSSQYLPEAYERLLVDALVGDATLFMRSDEVEAAWGIVDRLREAWDRQPIPDLPLYQPGALGPAEADALLERDQRHWRNGDEG